MSFIGYYKTNITIQHNWYDMFSVTMVLKKKRERYTTKYLYQTRTTVQNNNNIAQDKESVKGKKIKRVYIYGKKSHNKAGLSI